MIVHRLYIVAVMVCAALAVWGQDGTSGYSWINVTSSSKIYGLGGMNITLVDDELGSSDQNPALLGQEVSGQAMVNYMHYMGGSNFAGVRYAHAAGERGAWSASVNYFGYGSIKEATEDGTIVGTFSPADMAFGVQYSHEITGRWRGGVALKALYSHYAEYSALALAADVGVNYYDPEHDSSVSLVLANMGGQVKRFDEAYDRVPFDIRIGWSKVFGEFPVRFSVTAWNLTKWHLPYMDNGDGTEASEPMMKDTFGSNLFRHLIFGADLISNQNFYIGLGYNYKTRTDMSTYSRSFLSGWSLAAGLKVRSFGVGVAFAQPHTGATTLMFNLTMNVNDLLK